MESSTTSTELTTASTAEELVFEGTGEAGDVAVIFSPIIARRRRRESRDEPLCRIIQSDSDASGSDSFDGSFYARERRNEAMDNSYEDLGIDAVSCPQPLCSSSPIRSFSSMSNPERSKLSPDQSGFEGIGKGNERSMVDPCALQQQIEELKFQNQKLIRENADLRRQVTSADDAHSSLLFQNEELEKKVVQCRGHSERLKLITKELEETKAILACHEDKHTVHKKRIDRLEKDNAILMEEVEDRRKENVGLLAELDRSRQRVKDYEEELSSIRRISDEKINELIVAKTELEERLKISTDMVEELTALNEQLKGEKLELESNLTLAQNDQFDSRLTDLGVSASAPDFSHRMRSILSEVLEDLRLIREEFNFRSESSDRDGKEGRYGSVVQNLKDNCVEGGLKQETLEETAGGRGGATTVNSSYEPEGGPKDVDVVRRIHEELAEFRVQLKKSQELFHAFNSTQAFEVTKSCPLLADDGESTATEEKVSKPQLCTIATQTDAPAVASSSSSPLPAFRDSRYSCGNSTSNTSEDVENLANYMNKLQLDDNDLDKLSDDDDSYRVTINLPTVLEESEQETETSPATFPRRMSSERSRRNKLTRMSQFEEPKSENESEREYYSPPSSLPSSKNTSTYNSLERPLQFSAVSPGSPAVGDDFPDRDSMRSNSTYGSPLSSPSYYYTPSQGSSEETLANNDGDKTPVNEDFMDEFANGSDACDSNRSSPKYLEKRQKPIGRIVAPIDDRSNSFSQNVIDESAKEELTKYAYDPVLRTVSEDAAVLRRDEWRTLKGDLHAKDLQEYNKSFAQEEGMDSDGIDRGPVRTGEILDPEDEAEKTIFENQFDCVVEKLFESLDRFQLKSRPDIKITQLDVEKINNRFLSLSTAFKTSHRSLPQREEQSNKELDTVRNKINDSISQLTSTVEKIREHESVFDIKDLLLSIEQNSEEVLMNTDTLTKKSKEVGSIDLEKRVYKLIEVMILYVHILRHYQVAAEERKSPKKPSRDEESPAKKVNGNIPSNNNNNNEKMRWTGGYLGEGQNMERWISKGYEFVRRELSWPWNWEQTWKGVKQCFSILLMLTGLLIIFKSVFPIVSADTRGCNNGQSTTFVSLLGKQASLIHEQTPTL